MCEHLTISSPCGPRWRRLLLLGLLVFLGFGLRIFRLQVPELRGDEAFDALFSVQAVDVILTQLQSEQPYPPLFHVGLHFWLGWLGQSEVVQRLPAVMGGVLLVPVVYQLARLLLSDTTPLIAAALVAVNPFVIWHSQDGRMYALFAVFSLASMWLAVRLLQSEWNGRVGVAYWAVTVLALFTHYFAWLVLLAENVAAGLFIWQQERRRGLVGRWLVWQAAVVLPQVPWLVFVSGLLISHTSNWIQPVNPLEMLKRAATTFSMGVTLPPVLTLPALLVMASLFVAGSLFREKDSSTRGNGRAFLLPFIAIPIVATVVVSLRRPACDEKYLIAIVAPYLILVAHGLSILLGRWKPLGLVAGICILAATGWSLANYYFESDYAKSPSWRDLVAAITTSEMAEDIIIYNYPDPGLQYYYRGNLPLRLLPASPTASQERTAHTLQELAADHRRLWVVLTEPSAWDPGGWIEQWLACYSDLVDERSIDSLLLQMYHTPATFLEQMQPVYVELGDQIELLGYRLTPAADEAHAPGDQLVLVLYWKALRQVPADYTVFVHLSGASEQIWAQDDGQPVNGTFPTTAWRVGDIVVDRHTIEVDEAVPAGTCRLLAGMYSSSTAQRLPIAGPSDVVTEDRILLSTLELIGSVKAQSSSTDQLP
jgi:4-amino-4-deoxy-L-arabinose transferase-like glycosyltransferase